MVRLPKKEAATQFCVELSREWGSLGPMATKSTEMSHYNHQLSIKAKPIVGYMDHENDSHKIRQNSNFLSWSRAGLHKKS
jgi:hypothetical protein